MQEYSAARSAPYRSTLPAARRRSGPTSWTLPGYRRGSSHRDSIGASHEIHVTGRPEHDAERNRFLKSRGSRSSASGCDAIANLPRPMRRSRRQSPTSSYPSPAPPRKGEGSASRPCRFQLQLVVASSMNIPLKDPLVLFMPSGRRGRFPVGTPVLDAARSLGVYIESVCGGRGICGRCQIEVQEGEFAKHGITSAQDHLSPFSETEARYVRIRGELENQRRLSCSATIQGDLVVDVPQDVQINRQIVRKRAETRAHRARSDHAALLRRGRRAGHAQAARRHRPAAARAREGLALRRAAHRLRPAAEGAEDSARGRVEGDRRRAPRPQRPGGDRRSGRACTISPAASPSTSARPPSPAISRRCSPGARSPPPASRTRRSASAKT